MSWEFSDVQNEGLTAVNVSFAALSFVGSTFILFMLWRAPDLRQFFFFRLVAFLSMSDVLFSMSNFIGAPSDGSPACYAQAIGRSYFELSSCLWNVVIARTLHITVLSPPTRSSTVSSVEGSMAQYHLFAWGSPLVLTALPLTTNSYGDTGGWCWVSMDPYVAGIVWRFAQYYVPVWIAIAYSSYVCFGVSKKLEALIVDLNTSGTIIKSSETPEGHQAPDTVVSLSSLLLLARIKYFPMVLVGCSLFGTIDRVVELTGHRYYPLSVLHLIGKASMGILNAWVYCNTPVVHSRIKPVFQDLWTQCQMGCGCCPPSRSYEPAPALLHGAVEP